MQVNLSISFLLSQYTMFSFLFALEVCQSAVLKQNVKNSPASIDPIVEWGLKEVISSRRYRRSVLSTNSNIGSIASKTPSYFSNVRLFVKTQVFLQITQDGTVSGTVQCTSEYSKIWFVNALVFNVSNCQKGYFSYYLIIDSCQLLKGSEFRTRV